MIESEKSNWEWDIDAIHRRTIADGVAELLSRKLERLPVNVRRGLQILSCFEPPIDHQGVDIQVIEAVKNYDPNDSSDIALALDVAKREFLIESSDFSFSFSHSLIQKTAFDLIPDRVSLVLKLVTCLIAKCTETNGADNFLFSTVDLMNKIDSDHTAANLQQSQLFSDYNLKAGQRLIELGKFSSATKYLERGMSYLRGNIWSDHYYLAVNLWSSLAMTSYALGQHEKCFSQVNQVFESATNFEDKFMSYFLYINLLGAGSTDTALEKLYYLLPFAGEPIDPNLISQQVAIDEMAALNQALSGSQKDMLLHLPPMIEHSKLMSMKLLGLLSLYESQKKAFLGGFVAARMIRISLQYGQCEDTVYAIALFSSTLVYILNYVDEAYALAQIVLSMMRRYNVNRLIPKVYPLIYGSVTSTKDNLYLALDPLSSACHLAFSQGVHEYAILNTLVYVRECLACGKNLPELVKELAVFTQQHVSMTINVFALVFEFASLNPTYICFFVTSKK